MTDIPISQLQSTKNNFPMKMIHKVHMEKTLPILTTLPHKQIKQSTN